MPQKGDAAPELRALAATGVVVALAAVAAQTVLYLANVYAFDRSIILFDLEEGAVVTWASSSAAFAVAFVAALLSFVDPSRRARLVVLACAVAFLSFDDAAFVHERIAFRLTDALDVADTYVQLVWPALYLPLLVLVAALLLQLARHTRLALRLVVVGLLALAAGVALELAGLALDRGDYGPETTLRVLGIAGEEGVELAGWILIATGAAVRLLVLARERDGTPAEA